MATRKQVAPGHCKVGAPSYWLDMMDIGRGPPAALAADRLTTQHPIPQGSPFVRIGPRPGVTIREMVAEPGHQNGISTLYGVMRISIVPSSICTSSR